MSPWCNVSGASEKRLARVAKCESSPSALNPGPTSAFLRLLASFSRGQAGGAVLGELRQYPSVLMRCGTRGGCGWGLRHAKPLAVSLAVGGLMASFPVARPRC